MARSHGRVKVEIWKDPDWRALTPRAQWAYVLLISQPTINNCGVLPFVPRRWARYANGITFDDVAGALTELEASAFVIVDDETQEVLVRTFIAHDRIERQPNLLKAAKTEYGRIESARLRDVLSMQYPHLFDPRAQKPLFTMENEDLPEPLRKGVSEDLTEGVPDRARDHAGARADGPSPFPNPSGEAPTAPSPEEESRDETNLASPPAASQTPPATSGGGVARDVDVVLPHDEAFAAANRFVVTGGGWRDPRVNETIRREWPELDDDDVSLLVSTANEMALREVAG